jgi:undecaprenyl diphosphate synthase
VRLSTAGQPPVDLMIRTGGESRISNFMLWQLAYAELYFCDTLWPEFDGEGLQQAIRWFAGRQRRFGRVPEAA